MSHCDRMAGHLGEHSWQAGPMIDALCSVVEAYDAAADKFIEKVITGRARSVETFAELTAARALSMKYDVAGWFDQLGKERRRT